jgi:ATP-dependent exoDNAse (exonuclease V) beta subunit
MKRTPQQHEIITRFTETLTPVACLASAGTGKTHLITELFREFVETKKVTEQNILAVTFSRNAAAEMESRMSAVLTTDEPKKLSVYTIHGFCLWILRLWGHRLGLPFEMDLLPGTTYQKRMRRILRRLIVRTGGDMLESFPRGAGISDMVDFTYNVVESGLRPWPPPGSLSPEELFERARDSELSHVPWSQLVTQLAAWTENRTQLDRFINEHRESFRQLAQQAPGAFTFSLWKQFHALFQEIPAPRGNVSETELGGLIKAARTIARSRSIDEWDPDIARENLKRHHQLISYLSTLESEVSTIKRNEGWFSFQDVERFAFQLLSECPDVRAVLQKRFPVVLLDECQDTNLRQWAIMKSVLPTDLKGLFAVGDMKQCLYQFRGADPEAFATITRDVEKERGTIVRLVDHFRSQKELLSSINTVSEQLFGELAPRLQAHQTDRESALVLAHAHEDETTIDDAELSARACGKLHEKGLAWSDMTILVRSLRGRSQRYVEAFRAAGIPLYVESGREFFEHPLCQFVRHLFYWRLHPDQALSLFILTQCDAFPDFPWEEVAAWMMKHPEATLWQALETNDPAVTEFLRQCQDTASDHLFSFLGHSPQILQWLSRAPFPKRERTRLQTLERLYAELPVTDGELRDEAFVAYLDDGVHSNDQIMLPTPRANAVILRTIHASKGLQAPAVLIPQLRKASSFNSRTRDIFSSRYFYIKRRDHYGNASHDLFSRSFLETVRAQAREEDRRIFYVAITRAKQFTVAIDSAEELRTADGSWKRILESALPELSRWELAGHPSPKIPQSPTRMAPTLGPTFFAGRPRTVTMTELAQNLSEYDTTRGKFVLSISQWDKAVRAGTNMHTELQNDTPAFQKLWSSLSETYRLPFDPLAARAYREHTVCLRLPGQLVRGKMDVMFYDEKSKAALVIDYKSRLDLPAGAQSHPYFFQIQLYAWALEQAAWIESVHCGLVDLRERRFVSVPWTDKIRAEMERRLSQLPGPTKAPLQHAQSSLEHNV